MKLLELTVENLRGVPDGAHAFGEPSGRARDLVVLVDAAAGQLIQTIAALLEAVRVPAPTPHRLAWWAGRHGNEEARLRAHWALSEGEAALAGVSGRTAVSEWRFGPGDQLPRQIPVEGALPQGARADLGRYLWVDPNEISIWMGADPLAELLAGIARQDVAATRVSCRRCVGIVCWRTADTFAALNKAIAPVFPALRLERVACEPGEAPVACFRDGARVELDQLADAERKEIHLVAAVHAGEVRGGVVLAGGLGFPAPGAARERWLDWLATLATTREIQLVVAVERRDVATSACHKVVELRADARRRLP